MSDVQVFGPDNLPSDPETWGEYVKLHPTRMLRIEGPFRVEFGNGHTSPTCEDGFLAIDARQPPVPYPVPKWVADQVYRKIGPVED